jgi:DnaK suppressor protein
MTDRDHAEFEARLLSLKADLEALLEATAEGAAPVDLETPIGRLSRIDAIQAQGLTSANRARTRVRLQHTLAALAALRSGDYGECRRCGDDIGRARLEASPEAPLCIACMEEMERRR